MKLKLKRKEKKNLKKIETYLSKWNLNLNKLYRDVFLSQVITLYWIFVIAEKGKAIGLLKSSSKRKRTSEIEEVKKEE